MRKILCLSLLMGILHLQLFAQQTKTVTGRILDESGSPVPNASILVKGQRIGTTSLMDGSFQIKVSSDVKELMVSSLSYTSQVIPVGKIQNAITVTLKASSVSLSEVVITGYGSVKRADVTSSTVKVGGEKLQNIPLSSPDQMLQGAAAGLRSVSSSGQPGSNQQIRIRGVGSFAASSQPLFVVDGIQINSGQLSRNTSSSNVLANMNSDDIESITVLKDASATAIYGARGSNGVIVITTKRGKAGKTQFRVSAEIGENRHGTLPPAGIPLRTPDWLMLFKEGYANSWINNHPTDALSLANLKADTAALTYGDGTVNTDWLGLLTRSGGQHQYNISASGGDEKTKFFLSGGYFKQEANVIGSDLTRYTASLNLDHTVSKKLSLAFNIQPSYTHQNTPLTGSSYFSNPVSEIYFARPTSNPYNADGTFNISRAAKDFPSLYNPLYIDANDIRSLNSVSANSKVEAKYNILSNLSFTSRIGLQYVNLEEYQYNNPNHGDGFAAHGRGYAYNERYFLYDWTNQFDYKAELLKSGDLTLNAKLGYEAISSKGYFVTAASQNFPTSTLTAAANASTPTIGSNNGTEYTIASVFGNASLNYKGKYILAGTLRRDGSSRFSPTHEYGTFPSGSIAWNVSKEDFLAGTEWITDLKLRASYGVSGNAEITNSTGEINNYAWRQTLGYGLNYNGQPGGGFNNIGNQNLQWESSKQTDIGADASFLKNRLNITVDYYKKVIDKLIFSAPTSLTIGFSTINQNIGAMENTGLEFTVNATPLKVGNFNWDMSFNITYNKNKVTEIVKGQTQLISGQTIIKPGYDINTYYMREWAGVNPDNGDPLWYADSSHKATTNNYNSAARIITNKSISPKYFGGFSNTFSYKGVSLTADLYYNFGNYVYDGWAAYFYDQINSAYGKYAVNLERWQKPGDITNVPKPVYNSTSNSSSISTRFLFKGDYIRLRNIAFGYTLPSSITKQLHLTAFSVYVRGTNLWTKNYDKNLPFDPEQGTSGNTGGLNILYNKSLTAGINIGF